ncbi:MAG: hypothetical protein ACXWQO_02780 [Bdellovibrionota bacterium]
MIDVLQRKVEVHENEQGAQEETLDPRVLSSVLVNVKLAQTSQDESNPQDPHTRLLELTHSSPISALLDSAAIFAKRQNIAPHEALQQIIVNLQEIDKLWNQVLLKEGLARLSSQYH